MNYKELNDYELINRFNEGYEDAKDILYEKYLYIVETEIKKYTKAAYVLGYEYNDLYQDALVGLSDALNNYREDKNASLSSFITLCVNRKINASIKKAGRLKNKIVKNSLSLEETYGQSDTPLMNLISDNFENDPLENIVKEEKNGNLERKIKELLSNSEYEVFILLQKGLKYDAISKKLNKDPKQIDNTIQRIKNKLKTYLNLNTLKN